MAKRGRPRSVFRLTTGNDPSLWKHRSLAEALQVNIDVLAALVAASMSPPEDTATSDHLANQMNDDLVVHAGGAQWPNQSLATAFLKARISRKQR